MMKSDAAVKRSYRSSVRDAQARATRRAIIDAAARLFAHQGYVATSIDEIAAEAGVGRATVFTSVGGKAALLKAAYDVAIVGDDEPVRLTERPQAQAIRSERNPQRALERYAAMATEIGGRVAAIYEALRGAANAETEVRALYEEIETERRAGAAKFIRIMRGKGRLRPELTSTELADVVWMLTDPGLYHRMVLTRGWTPKRFESWLARTMKMQLLD
jgi:AcrR family transcriptional regulator